MSLSVYGCHMGRNANINSHTTDLYQGEPHAHTHTHTKSLTHKLHKHPLRVTKKRKFFKQFAKLKVTP